ncbi:MAG: cytochrome c [Fimbriimonadales bacterium]|nr:cytochrome c [Fimbriimonadales bacterium]
MDIRWLRMMGYGVLLMVMTVLLAACGNQGAPSPNGTAETKPSEPSSAAKTTEPAKAVDPEAAKGKLVFVQTGCNACHMSPAVGKDYPDLRGLYGSQVKLKDGTTVTADETYLRESIVNPNKQIVAGYPPSMPPYNYLKEEQINQLIAYIKSLKDEKPEFVKH